MKKIIFLMLSTLLLVSGILLINRNTDSNNTKPIQESLSAAESKAIMKKWEATPAGIFYNEWKVSPAGKKVFTSESKIRMSLKEFKNMEGMVTSLSLPQGSRFGLGIMVKIQGDDFILTFDAEKNGENAQEIEQLKNLKVNDKLIIRSHNVSHAPKYAFPIVSGDYIEKDGKMIFHRIPNKGGC